MFGIVTKVSLDVQSIFILCQWVLSLSWPSYVIFLFHGIWKIWKSNKKVWKQFPCSWKRHKSSENYIWTVYKVFMVNTNGSQIIQKKWKHKKTHRGPTELIAIICHCFCCLIFVELSQLLLHFFDLRVSGVGGWQNTNLWLFMGLLTETGHLKW